MSLKIIVNFSKIKQSIDVLRLKSLVTYHTLYFIRENLLPYFLAFVPQQIMEITFFCEKQFI